MLRLAGYLMAVTPASSLSVPVGDRVREAGQDLQAVLDWLACGPGNASCPQDRFVYPAGSDVTCDRAAVQRDLWGRACSVARHGDITLSELRLWAHWYGVIDGHRWSKAELRRRFRLGRERADRIVAMVTEMVTATFSDDRSAVAFGAMGPAAERTDLQEAAAGLLGRAVAEDRPYLAETRLAVQDLLRARRAMPVTGHVRLPGGAGETKRNLKTTRHADASVSEWHRAILDSTARRLGLVSEGAWPCLPLWQPAEPVMASLEQSCQELVALAGGRDRQAIAGVLRDGHHYMTHVSADRELVVEFLMHEVAILRDNYNLMALPVLDVLEHLVPASDYRTVILARDRAHLLEVHHLWSAAELWLKKAAARLSSEQIRWPDPDARLLNAVNVRIRLLSVRIDQAIGTGDISLPGHQRMRDQVRSMLGQLDSSPAALREWRHLADRHDVQLRLAVKGIERRHGIGTRWGDEELLRLEAADREVALLPAPARHLSWQARKLSILLDADQPAEFVAVAQRAFGDFERYGPAWPNQIAALRIVLEAAMRRRGRAWIRRRPDMHDLTRALPSDTDELLRHPLAIPSPMIIHGTPIF